MKVKLTRRWGPYRSGRSVDVDDVQGTWLIQHNYAESSGNVQAPQQEAAAPGKDGPAPLAGGDATRRRPRVGKPERDPQRNYARQAEGSAPTYRAGYGAEDRKREGVAGRNGQGEEPREAGAPGVSEGEDEPKPRHRRKAESS